MNAMDGQERRRDPSSSFLLRSRKEMLDYFLLEYDCTRELVERARSMARGDRSTTTTTTTTNTTSTTSNNSMTAGPSVMQQQQQQQQQQQPPPPPRSKRDRIVSAFKARIKPLQSHRLLDERERILALSQMPLKWKKRKKTTRAKKSTGEEGEENAEVEDESVDEMHRKMLLTVYAKLTGDYREEKIDTVGKHWETIGFQGEDPSTDVRACGALAVANMLSFVLFNATPAIPATEANGSNGLSLIHI